MYENNYQSTPLGMGLVARTLIMLHAYNKGADQPAPVIHFLEGIVTKLATCNLLIFILVSVAEQAG